jgi:hypothetical protein
VSAVDHPKRLLQAINASSYPMDDDELSRHTGIKPRQTVNQILRRLEREGVVSRRSGANGKLVTTIVTGREPVSAAVPDDPPVQSPGAVTAVAVPPGHQQPPGSSREQRDAERFMLDLLGAELGTTLAPERIALASGARVEIDGTDAARSILVECWAHQGAPKPAQKHKVLSDALKLTWIASTLYPRPRLILCMSDPMAAAPFVSPSRSWAAQALNDLGIEVLEVQLPEEIRLGIQAAQTRQYR